MIEVAPNTDDGLIDRLRSATLGKYDIYAELGRGGMAAVFLALDVALDRKVAIKAMLPEIAVDMGAVERFRREARFAASLSHPSIVPVYTVGESLNPPFFVMKFVDGRALDSVLRNEGAQSPALVQAVLQQVGGALDYAHRRSITHRDVKPANIMLDDDGWILLSDFGIAKTTDALSLTSSGMLVGTPAYMSPEHFNGGDVGPSADQYALGCVAYELLTGKRPFERKTIGEVMKAHLMDDVPALDEIDPACPPKLVEIIHRMLAKEPAGRFPSLAAMVHALGVAGPEQQRQVTTHIVQLAKSGEEYRPRISQPISPVPSSVLRRKPASGAQAAVVNSTASSTLSSRRRQRSAMIGASLFMAIALTIWSVTKGNRSETRGAAPVAAADSFARVPAAPVTSAVSTKDSSLAPERTKPKLPDAIPAKKPGADRSAQLAEAARGTVTKPGTPNTALGASPQQRDTVAPSAPAASPAPAAAVVDSQPRQGTNAAVDSATITIGSRTPGAVLYVNGTYHSALFGRKLVPITLAPGRHRIVVTIQDCAAPFDTTVILAPGEKLNFTYKNPACDRE